MLRANFCAGVQIDTAVLNGSFIWFGNDLKFSANEKRTRHRLHRWHLLESRKILPSVKTMVGPDSLQIAGIAGFIRPDIQYHP